MQELTIKDILGILRKWIALLIVVPIIVFIIAAAYSYGYSDDIYTASTSLYVLVRYEDSTGTTRYDTTTSNYFTSDYKELFNRSPVVTTIEETLGIESLKKLVSIDISSITNTRLVEINVSGEDPELCATVANMASSIFKEYIVEFMQVDSDSVSIPQQAQVPTVPSGPARLRNMALAYLVALVLCVGIVLMVEMLNTKIKDSNQIETGLGLPVLGNIMDYRKELTTYLESEGAEKNRLYQYISEPVREGVKAAAMNISFGTVDRPVQSIAITSTTPGEGKSSLAVLLASAFAEEGKYVLVVDMDFRHPSIGKLLKRRNKLDLMDYLSGRANLEEVVTPVGIENLRFIDNSHSSILLSRIIQSDSFDQFMQKVEKSFDLVIFDTPPLGMFIDAAILASKMDGVVTVIASNAVEMKDAQDMIEQLNKSGATVLGAVLNYKKYEKGNNYYYSKEYGKYGKREERINKSRGAQQASTGKRVKRIADEKRAQDAQG